MQGRDWPVYAANGVFIAVTAHIFDTAGLILLRRLSSKRAWLPELNFGCDEDEPSGQES